MEIIIGSDHLGYALKEDLKGYLNALGHTVVEVGHHSANEPVDYPDMALDLAQRIASGESQRGILICGTGLGMAMVANKVPGGLLPRSVFRRACAQEQRRAGAHAGRSDRRIGTGSFAGRSLAGLRIPGGRPTPKVAKIKQLGRPRRARWPDQVAG